RARRREKAKSFVADELLAPPPIPEKLEKAAAAQVRVFAALEWLRARLVESGEPVASDDPVAESNTSSYLVEVDYGLPIETLMALDGFIAPALAELFSPSGVGRARYRLRLISFERRPRSEEVIAHLEGHG